MTKNIHVRVPKSICEDVDRLADIELITRAAWVRRLISRELKLIADEAYRAGKQ